MFKRIALIALCLTLAACAPDTDALRADVERGLTATYGADQFKIADLKRRGSAADSTAPASETRRVVYYDVELRLDRDITLGAWDKPGAASLVTLLGAGRAASAASSPAATRLATASSLTPARSTARTATPGPWSRPPVSRPPKRPRWIAVRRPPSRASCWTRWTRSRTLSPTAPPAPRSMSCSKNWNARCRASTAA